MVGTFREYLLPKYSSVLQACVDDVEAIHCLNHTSPNLGVDLYSQWLAKQASETYFDSTPSQAVTPEESLSLVPYPDDVLRRRAPKRYDARTDWYSAPNENFHDSPVQNRYDNSIELTSKLGKAAELYDELEALDWQVEKTLESRSVLAAKGVLLNLLQERAAKKEELGQHVILFAAFPQVVKDYIEFRFGSYTKKYPELYSRLKNLAIAFLPRPARYRDSIGAEYFPETNTIAYYLPPESLDRHWNGVVHEITHLVQNFLEGEERAIPSPPDIGNPEYYTDRETYHADKGEQHAFSEEASFLKFREQNAS